MLTFQVNIGSNQTPKNLASVTSLICLDAMDIDKPVFCISFVDFDLLVFLLLTLDDCFMARNFLFGYMKQLLSKLICNKLHAMYVLISYFP